MIEVKGASSGAPLTWAQTLAGLYLINDYRRIDRPPAPGWFRRHGLLVGLTGDISRRAALRLARVRECMVCGESLSPDSEGDHVVAVSRGGPPGLENYLPMCGRCNSSKGSRDLLEWWQLKGWSVANLPADAVTVYCRVMFARLRIERRLGSEAPDAVRAALRELYELLPSDEHQHAWWEKVRWVVGSK